MPQVKLLFTAILIVRLVSWSCTEATKPSRNVLIKSVGATAPRPVIIDTDIGSDIDDSFAIAFAIQNVHTDLDVKLVVTCTDDTTARAKIVAKLLTLLGKDSIPVGIGIKNDNKTKHTLFDWAKDFNLSSYKGGVFANGVDEMANIILNSSTVVDIIAIGPMTNFPTLLSHYPDVVKKARIRAMAGSIYKGYDNSSIPTAEYNVRMCPKCMSELLHAGWNVSITPLDTSGIATLTPVLMEEFDASTTPASLGLTSSLLYFCISNMTYTCNLKVRSPFLYDTVATLLTLPIAESFIDFKELKLTVTREGCTVINSTSGVPTDVALYWQQDGGLDRYKAYLTNVLSSG